MKKTVAPKVPHDLGVCADLRGFFDTLRRKFEEEASGAPYWERPGESGDIRNVLKTHLHFGLPASDALERMRLELGMGDGELESELWTILETVAEAWERSACYGADAVLLDRRERVKLCQRVAAFFATEFLEALGRAFKASVPAHPVLLEAK